ncbi:MAG: HAD-IIIA family hydrolase, partial [Pseudomonadales bacterium]
DTIHEVLQTALQRAGAKALHVYHCPHHPDLGCDCRKPEPGLLINAMQAAGVSAQETCFVGDSVRDLEAARNAGCTPILVRTGNGRQVEIQEAGKLGDVSVYDDLAACATALLAHPA